MDIQTARGIAARIWCDPDYEHVEMNVDLAERIAVMLQEEEANSRIRNGHSGASLFEDIERQEA